MATTYHTEMTDTYPGLVGAQREKAMVLLAELRSKLKHTMASREKSLTEDGEMVQAWSTLVSIAEAEIQIAQTLLSQLFPGEHKDA